MSSLLDPTLATERLTLRPPAEADIDAVVAGIGDLAVSKWLAKVPYPYTPEDGRQWLHGAAEGRRKGTHLSLVVTLADATIGGIGLHEPEREVPELGYWIARPHWRKGYAHEAAAALLSFSFEHLGKPAVAAKVFEGNDGSLALQLQLGFEITGRSMGYCLARKAELPNIETRLTAERFRATNS